EQLQRLPASAEIKLTYKRGDKTATATLTPAPVADQFEASRGFIFEPIQRIKIANTFGEQFQLGFEETKNSLSMVFRFLRKLGTQVPFTALGGPVTIARAAGYSAFEGPGKLLLFLTMLSANLAVINFMPIPMLDGGHMVFLTWEGIRGRPASEKFVIALHTVGFVCIISLMVFVLGLDLNIIPRNM
ncbi:MAG: metalloprotease, partial [Planctomycetes bacterium]|nr:metalloprotease [Planctomycetota bacterium]